MLKSFFLCVVLFASPCFADVRLPKIVGSAMVLQQQSEVRIWGWADSGESITVKCSWLDAPQQTTAMTDGNWQVVVATATAGGPHSISIQGNNQLLLEDVLFGEVWLASGQSNMEMPLVKVSDAYTGIQDSDNEVAAANYPNIRLFQVGNCSSTEPLDDVQSGISGINAALLREAQLETTAVDRTGMVVTMDIGNLTDIHPQNKQEVGRRLALHALVKDDGRDWVWSGPIYREAMFENGSVRLLFDHAQGGLATSDNQPPNHFVVAGDDREFHPATAEIDQDSIVVSAADVPHPKAVRFAFTSDAQPNLMNKSGLPASSFRTDRW